jgi:hypothetical protein
MAKTCFILAVFVWVGGPPPGFLQKEHFLCKTSTEKALRKGLNIQWTTARPRFENRWWTLTSLSWRTTPTLELHPLQRGNWFMSQWYGITNTNACAILLADFNSPNSAKNF